MAVFWVHAKTTKRNRETHGHGRHQLDDVAWIRSMHFTAIAPRKGFKGNAFLFKLRKQLPAWRKHGKPNIKIAATGVILLGHATGDGSRHPDGKGVGRIASSILVNGQFHPIFKGASPTIRAIADK